MANASVKRFRHDLLSASGDKVKMKKAFKSISAYLDSSFSKKQTGQKLKLFLAKNPRVKEIQEWSVTVMVDANYELVNC